MKWAAADRLPEAVTALTAAAAPGPGSDLRPRAAGGLGGWGSGSDCRLFLLLLAVKKVPALLVLIPAFLSQRAAARVAGLRLISKVNLFLETQRQWEARRVCGDCGERAA